MVGTVESGCFQYDTSIETQTHSKAVYLPPNKQQIEYPITLIESEDAVCTKYNTPLYQTFDNVRVVEKRGVGSIIFDLLEGKGDLHLNFVPDYKGWDEQVKDQFWSLMIASMFALVLIPYIIWTQVLALRSKIRLLVVIASLLSVAVGSYMICQVSWF